MRIGEKIKKLRTAKLMTQSELAGTEITRNMLSRIENGVAKPSMETLYYIASRLNVSPGFLLAEGADEEIYFKHNEIVGAKSAFVNGDFRIGRDICLHAESADDDEIRMILAECDLAIAVEEFNDGNLRAACEYFDEAVETCEKTVYRTDYVIAVAEVYFRYMRRISATLSSNVLEENVNRYPSLTDAFCRYIYAMERMEESSEEETVLIAEKDSPLTVHYEATLAMRRGNFAVAYEFLRLLLMSEKPIPKPMLYFVFCDLEICCREVEDFKGAYEYSMNKIELLQKLLT